LALHFVDREPQIDVNAIEDWERALDRVDSDALVTRALTDRYPDQNGEAGVRSLTRWSTVVRSCDRELEQLFRRGLSDMHVHVGGVRFAQAAWFDLMDGVSNTNTIYGLGRDRTLSDSINAARAARRELWSGLAIPEEDSPLYDRNLWWRWDKRRLVGERILLARCWRTSNPASDHEALVKRLDIYLTAKCGFFARARQRVESSPGLDYFKGSFEYLKPVGPIRGKRRGRYSSRLEMHPFGDALRFLVESVDLQRLEFRLAPEPSMTAMIRLASNFGNLMDQFEAWRREESANSRPIEVRLAFHLKRSRGKKGKGKALGPLLMVMDRFTAALRLALSDEIAGQPLRKWLARIDIAGQERDTSLVDCLPYIRLALGDRSALEERGVVNLGAGLTCVASRRVQYLLQSSA
jgi:hypothetical protein